MEKLIQLLNEYEKSITEIPVCWGKTNGMLQYGSYIQQVSVMYMISKHYGFIKRLVDNNKIDIEKIENTEYYLIDWFYYGERKGFGIERKDDVVKILLMLLSIQDNPIEFLISILK